MALASLLDDYPLLSALQGNSRRRNHPVMLSILDQLENQLDQRVGQVFQRLPSVLMEIEQDYGTTTDNGKKRKLLCGPDNCDQPKSKVLVTTKDDKYQVRMDASIYQPDEITVKVVNDRISISAKHETKSENCYEFHEMRRSFDLPEGVDPQTVISSLSPSGQLTIEAPMPVKQKETVTERLVPVQVCNGQETSEKSPAKSKETPTKNTDDK